MHWRDGVVAGALTLAAWACGGDRDLPDAADADAHQTGEEPAKPSSPDAADPAPTDPGLSAVGTDAGSDVGQEADATSDSATPDATSQFDAADAHSDSDLGMDADAAPDADPDATQSAPDASDADTAPTDAGSDADAAPAPPPSITLELRGPSAPIADVRVLLHDAQGEVLADLRTDSQGVVRSSLTPAMLTVLIVDNGDTSELERDPLTFVGLSPGDVLKLQMRDRFTAADKVDVGTYHVPPPAAYEDEYVFWVWARGCNMYNDTFEPITLGVERRCLSAGNENIVVASAGYSYDPAAYAVARHVPGPGTGTHVTLGPWHEPLQVRGTSKNLPVNDSATLSFTGYLADGLSWEAETMFDSDDWDYYIGLFPDLPFTQLLVSGSFDDDSTGRQAVQYEVFHQRPYAAAQAPLDFAQVPRPWAPPTSERRANRWRIRWGTSLSNGIDAFVVRASLYYPAPYDAGEQWLFVVPPGTTELTFPRRPKTGASDKPSPEDASRLSLYGVTALDLDTAQGYAPFKAQPLVVERDWRLYEQLRPRLSLGSKLSITTVLE